VLRLHQKGDEETLPARTVALRALIACRTANAWSDAVLADYISGGKLDSRDAGLCTNLCYGVLQNRTLLDWYIDQFLQGRKRIQPVLRDILRLAVYQILFLDRVPDSAAVNEAVKQTKKYLSQREAGLCNGLLRNLIRQKDTLTPPQDYAIRYSHPSDLVDLMKASVGKKLGTILAADNTRPETCAQVNTLKTTAAELTEIWTREGVAFASHPWMENCFLLTGTGDLEHLGSFQDGLFQIQDPAARLSVQVLGLSAGMKILDLCAAPGGKTMAAAMYMENQGSILSCDLHPGKLPQITAAAQRLGGTIVETQENDSTIFRPEWQGQFDAVIADVPCSGLGVIRKKPDIRYKDVTAMEGLPGIQAHILDNAGNYVKPGGQLLYSTCTILKRENEDVVREFLSRHENFTGEDLELPQAITQEEPGMLTLYQGYDSCDGFFLCRMRRSV
jgi:16S rRNA (cytosine967-C5)-methyltransferase